MPINWTTGYYKIKEDVRLIPVVASKENFIKNQVIKIDISKSNEEYFRYTTILLIEITNLTTGISCFYSFNEHEFDYYFTKVENLDKKLVKLLYES